MPLPIGASKIDGLVGASVTELLVAVTQTELSVLTGIKFGGNISTLLKYLLLGPLLNKTKIPQQCKKNNITKENSSA